MSAFLDQAVAQAKADVKTIVLPEGEDERIARAARMATDAGIAKTILLGDPDKIGALGVNLDGIEVIDPANAADHGEMAAQLAEIRKKKGMTLEEASEVVKDVTYYGVMMVKAGKADGMVSGACHSTGDTLRPALQILKTAPGSKIVSSFFVMIVPDCEYGSEGRFVFADCGLNQYPTAEELSEIAISSAESFRSFMDEEPILAMLAHSTYGSAKGESVDKVREATRLAQEKAPELVLDGELQLDAAIVPSVGESKAKGSKVAGHANVLIFPDIDAGNIGYKLVQRLAKAEAYGPIMQGLAAPVNDLSRGCSSEDAYGVIAITAIQAQKMAIGK